MRSASRSSKTVLTVTYIFLACRCSTSTAASNWL